MLPQYAQRALVHHAFPSFTAWPLQPLWLLLKDLPAEQSREAPVMLLFLFTQLENGLMLRVIEAQ